MQVMTKGKPYVVRVRVTGVDSEDSWAETRYISGGTVSEVMAAIEKAFPQETGNKTVSIRKRRGKGPGRTPKAPTK